MTITKPLYLFFTYGMTLRAWEETGIFPRETGLYLKLRDSGVPVTFVTYGDEREREYEERLPGIRVLPLQRFGFRPNSGLVGYISSIFAAWKIRGYVNAPSILKTNQLWGGWVPLLLKILGRGELLVRCGYEHFRFAVLLEKSWYKRCTIYWISKILYRRATRVIVTTEEMSCFIANEFGVDKRKISVVPNFIDISQFRAASDSEKKLARVVYVGRLSKQKNVSALVRACAQIGIGLDVIGDGELKEDLSCLAKEVGADVKFLGRVSNKELPGILAQYEIFVLPSHFEGHPKTLLEAMACGLAVVGTNVEGISSVIRHRETGLLSGTDHESLADAIRVLKDDPKLRAKVKQGARKFVEAECDLDTIVASETTVYRQLGATS